MNDLPERVLMALIGAVIALFLRELWATWKNSRHKKAIARLIVHHLQQIKHDLENHIKIDNGSAQFTDTGYCEIAVAEFLYHMLTTNMALFSGQRITKTVHFFHHYKVNMSTVKSRLSRSEGRATLTEGTYRNLLNYLTDAITELEGL